MLITTQDGGITINSDHIAYYEVNALTYGVDKFELTANLGFASRANLDETIRIYEGTKEDCCNIRRKIVKALVYGLRDSLNV